MGLRKVCSGGERRVGGKKGGSKRGESGREGVRLPAAREGGGW